MSTFLLYGVSNVGFGFALMFNPNVFYHSALARLAHEKTGLRMTDVSTAPGFNNALACMVIAVGAGSIRAGLTGSRGAQSTITLMRLVWTATTIASCIVAPDIMSASHAISMGVDVFMSAALLWGGGFSIPELLGLGTTRDRSGGKSKSKRR